MLPSIRFFLALVLISLAGISQAQNLHFACNERENGTAFYALEARTGQLSYMVDYGDDAGNWRKYGSPIGALVNGKFMFQANEREKGTGFFAMESMSGQLYYMVDYGDEAGKWIKYGGLIGKDTYTFEASERENGTAFFAINVTTGQAYYMLDYGSTPGLWKSYGGTVSK